jgi:pimeloyl-ACP methyl ester carboxylesterase
VYGPAGRSAWLDVDWRTHQRWVTVQGRPVNVIELGQGPPLVFVHGLAGSWQNWLEQLPVFAEQRRVIALDLPGFGHSPLPAEKISIPGYARTLDALCQALEIDAAAFVGNSMGGFIGAELAISFPRRVERLVLVSAAGLSIEHQRSEPGLAALRRAENVLAFYTGWIASRSDAVARRSRLRRAVLALVAAHPERLPAPLAAEQIRGSGKPGFIDAVDALTSYPIRDRLGEIACPTLVVWGDRDRLVPVGDALEFERLIPNARKVIFEDTGHVAMLERPARFNAVLEDFLADDAS